MDKPKLTPAEALWIAQGRSERARMAVKAAQNELEAALKAERQADEKAIRASIAKELGRS